MAGRSTFLRRVVPAVLVLVVVAGLLLAGVRIMGAASAADRGSEAMAQARERSTGSVAKLVDSLAAGDRAGVDQAIADLRIASEEFSSAADQVGSAAVAPLRVLPVVGRQLRSVQDLAESADTAASRTADTLQVITDELSATEGGPTARLESARTAQAELDRLAAEIADLDTGSADALVPPVADARNTFEEERSQLLGTLQEVSTSLRGVTSFLEGPTRYLVLAANNAEMRDGSGMFLQAGVITIEDGRFSLGDFVPTADLVLPTPGTTLDPDVANLWGWLSPDREWRNINLTPRFDESARMAADMWVAAGREPVDGVLAMDVTGLRDLLRVVGPVTVPWADGTREISADNVQKQLLTRQYVEFDDRGERRERLGGVAAEVFTAFNDRPWSSAQLVAALRDAGTGRNLLLWSPDQVQEEAWQALGASGTVSDDSLLLAVNNRAGNKLDPYLTVDATLSQVPAAPTATTVGGDGVRRLSVRVTLRNDTPGGLPRYMAGPYPGTDLAEGEYLGILSLTVPAGATNPTMSGAELAIVGEDGPARTLAGQVRIPRGGTQEVTIEFDLPTSWTSATVLPSARIPPATWTVDGKELPGRKPTTVDLTTLG